MSEAMTDEDVYRAEGLAPRAREPRHGDSLMPAQPLLADKIADEWRCAACKALVPVTESAEWTLAAFNRELARRGEDRIDENECVFCDKCRALRADAFRKRRARFLEQQAEMLARLHNPSTPTHLLGEAEDWVALRYNEGKDIVKHCAKKRVEAKLASPRREL